MLLYIQHFRLEKFGKFYTHTHTRSEISDQILKWRATDVQKNPNKTNPHNENESLLRYRITKTLTISNYSDIL